MLNFPTKIRNLFYVMLPPLKLNMITEIELPAIESLERATSQANSSYNNILFKQYILYLDILKRQSFFPTVDGLVPN